METINNFTFKTIISGRGVFVDFFFYSPQSKNEEFDVAFGELRILFGPDFNPKMKEYFMSIMMENKEILQKEIGQKKCFLILTDIKINVVDFEPDDLISGLIKLIAYVNES